MEDLIGTTIDQVEAPTVDIDDQDFFGEMPEMGVPAIDLAFIARAISDDSLVPPGYEIRPLGTEDFVVEEPQSRRPTRATLSKSFYADHFDHTEFWTPGSRAFPAEGLPDKLQR